MHYCGSKDTGFGIFSKNGGFGPNEILEASDSESKIPPFLRSLPTSSERPTSSEGTPLPSAGASEASQTEESLDSVNGGIFDSEGCCFFQSGPSSRAHGGRFSEIRDFGTFLTGDQTIKASNFKFKSK